MCPITEIKAEGEPADDGGRGGGNDGWSFGFCFHRQTVALTHYYVGCLPSHLILPQDTPRDRTAHRCTPPSLPLHSGSQVSSLRRTGWCDQSGVEFSAKSAPNLTPLSSQNGWRTPHGHVCR